MLVCADKRAGTIFWATKDGAIIRWWANCSHLTGQGGQVCFWSFSEYYCVHVCSCLCVHAAHHRLLGDVHQLLNVVILVLFKGGKEHVQHHLTLRPHHLPLWLLFLLIHDLEIKQNVNGLRINIPLIGWHPSFLFFPTYYIEIVVGHGLENGSDGSLQLLGKTWTLGGLFKLHSETKRCSTVSQIILLKKNDKHFLFLQIRDKSKHAGLISLDMSKTDFLLNIRAVIHFPSQSVKLSGPMHHQK